MTTAVLNYSKLQKKVQSRVGSLSLPRVNWKMLCLMVGFVCLALLMYYVWQVRYLTSGSYVVSGYEAQISQLIDEKKTLEVSFAESSFLGQVQAKISELNFQKTTSIKYIQIPDNSLAKAK
ncbi:MAG: hypothetical protein Q8Q48_00075 [Candidatus Staskawiczbacteria bacterium]|nr:hypothetical protein [Candidatus Staskawiczbacteria bacterium]